MIRTYTETYDVNTADGQPTLIGFHTPIGRNPYHFLYPAFMMYEKYKYLGCDISIVNSAHLPVSITAYDIEGGQANMDPRDSLNPIMFRGCHGNSLGNVLNSIYAGMGSMTRLSAMDKEELNTSFKNYYYTALGDNGWRKSPISKTLRINGLHPLVYRQAMNIQVTPSNMEDSEYYENENYSTGVTTTSGTFANNNSYQPGRVVTGGDNIAGNISMSPIDQINGDTGTEIHGSAYSLFTNGVQALGWMDTLTRMSVKRPVTYGDSQITNGWSFSTNKIAMLPKVFMGVLMLPAQERAYNFLRISIRHKFAFKSIRGISAGAGDPVFNPTSNAWGYREEFTAGSIPDSSKRREEKGIVPIRSQASTVLEPPVIDCEIPNSSFETISSEDNVELVNAKSA